MCKHLYVIFALIFLALTSCEKIDLNETSSVITDKSTITLHITGYNIIPFDTQTSSRANADITTHIDIALFDADGNKVVKINQKHGDEKYGEPTIEVVAGTYTLVVIAHSGSGVATITSPSEVTFPNNKVTDTFYACKQLDVNNSVSSASITLQRAVSMVRFVLTDTTMPEEFAQLKFYYTGGSSTFSPITGFGSKNSRQTEYRTLTEVKRDGEGRPMFEVYTFPHDKEGELKFTLTPQNSSGTDIAAEHAIDLVPIQLNAITEFKGSLFPQNSQTSTIATSAFALSINDKWLTTTTYTF